MQGDRFNTATIKEDLKVGFKFIFEQWWNIDKGREKHNMTPNRDGK
jgi:hypothetical protein